jgi:uncharacterized protein (DUF1015 family)
MIERGWLVRDVEPAYYVYRLRVKDQAQTGILCAAAVADYLEDRIKKHEHTRPEKVQDRVRLNEAIGAHPGPVFLTYADRRGVTEAVAAIVEPPPETCFQAADGVEHALWVVAGEKARSRIEELLGEVSRAYVADGHHRAEAAASVSRGAAAGPRGEPRRHFLAAYFPASQLRVLDYNRVVRDLAGLGRDAFLERVRAGGFDVHSGHQARRPPHAGTFGMYLAGTWYLLTARPEIRDADDPVGSLDVSVLARRLLQPILGLGDLRTDGRVDFVGGGRGLDELERRVDSGEHVVAFALHPTRLDDVMRVADSGGVMPPKSTWFEPKLRSGMVVQPFDGDTL